MKRFLILAAALMMVLPSFAQKLSKEEKAAQQKALYETMVKALEEKDWAIVPTSYIDADGVDNQLTDNSIFISYEKTNMFMQGYRVCGNSYTNIAEVKEYDLVKDKKGNLKKLVITVQGRHIQGRYPALFDYEKKEDLEELIKAAFQKAQNKAQEVVAEKTKEVMGVDTNDLASML